MKVAPATRTRTRTIKALTSLRRNKRTEYFQTRTIAPHSGLCDYVTPPAESLTVTPAVSNLTSVPDYQITSKDSTRRLRKPYETMNEFETFTYSTHSSDRTATRTELTRQYNTVSICLKPSVSTAYRRTYCSTEGGAAYYPSSNIAALRSSTIASANTYMQDNLAGMLKDIFPSSRRYSLFRNIVELRDLPKSIVSLRSTLQDLVQASAHLPSSAWDVIRHAKLPQHVPNEYLSFWFGWKATYDALMGLLATPQRLAKEVNFLMSRRGKPTTLRLRRKFAGVPANTPGWTYNPSGFVGNGWSETTLANSTNYGQEVELRLVVNMLFDFPEVGVPALRNRLIAQKLGVSPTFADLYHLTPWTWLIDWFTGLGNYIDLIDVINTDPNLINWGVMTCVLTGHVTTHHRTYFDNVDRYRYYHQSVLIDTNDAFTRVNTFHESRLEYRAQVRKDLTNTFGVKSTLKPSSLTTYQASIIGALLGQRSGIGRF